ncbi:hypothetical protein EV424DRAFT_1541841 [Suillus variegatus]|nr:hypothetical protein EV424DRAFT_1541841 [Suillus variegatus]
MSSRPKVGYVYTPPSNLNNYVSDIMEWVGYPQFEFDSIKSLFLKVAYIQEYVTQTSGMEVVFCPVYVVNINDFAISQQTAFIVPEGWKKVCVYTDEQLATLPAIQKVVKSDDPITPLDYSAGFVDDDFMSAISSLSEGIWMNNNTTSVFEAPSSANSTGIDFRQHSPTPATLPVFRPSAPLTYGGSTLLHTTFIPPPILIKTPDVPLAEGHYILCDPQEFHDGIKHTQEYLDKYFFTVSVCIQDAKTWAKHYLHVFGLEPNQSYKNRCIRAIEEMITISKSCGQAVEKGLQCNQTGQQKDLDILNAIGLVTGKRDAFMKSLKSHSAAYIDKSDRASIGGYSLQSKPPQLLQATSMALLG